MRDADAPSRPATLILTLFWGSLLLSLTLPWGLLTLFEVSAHRRTMTEALKHVHLHFFAPGYQYFLVGLLSAAPFAVCAVFLLFHLGWRPLDRPRFVRRLAGVSGSLLLMLGISFWTHLSALMYPDAQGALVYLFLPYILLVLIPLGYGIGRLIIAFIRIVRPSETDAVEG
ncbi:hypothetical protein [Nitrospira moscoviensis]|uniref:Uncharacterized protein n=1 Tax=Nitrospira moscoviensis TaxID=42253 RepID=A0A0K2G9A7_NITMO|nr:hypothetical protein [Nitrospira moscoviensis]ALA57520.1 conserved membrane protein of unknown function [Nitrospira moscoviensis]